MPLPVGNSPYYPPQTIAFAQKPNAYPTIQPTNTMYTPPASAQMTMSQILGFSPISPATASALGGSGSGDYTQLSANTARLAGVNPSIFSGAAYNTNSNGASFIDPTTGLPTTPMTGSMPYTIDQLALLSQYQNSSLLGSGNPLLTNPLLGTAGTNPFLTNPLLAGLGTTLPTTTSTPSSSASANPIFAMLPMLSQLLGGNNNTNPSSMIDTTGCFGKINADGTITLPDPSTTGTTATYTDADENTQTVTASDATTAPEGTLTATWEKPDGTTGSTTASTSDARSLDLTLGSVSYDNDNSGSISYETGTVASSTIEEYSYSPPSQSDMYDYGDIG